MAAYRRVYDSHYLQVDCQEPGSAPEPSVHEVTQCRAWLVLGRVTVFGGGVCVSSWYVTSQQGQLSLMSTSFGWG